METYRNGEKSIKIPIIVNHEIFFNKSEEQRFDFLKQSILIKLDLLTDLKNKKNLDTKVDLLESDLQILLS